MRQEWQTLTGSLTLGIAMYADGSDLWFDEVRACRHASGNALPERSRSLLDQILEVEGQFAADAVEELLAIGLDRHGARPLNGA
ncbi:hypothetical protein [Nonomuraea jiangxiensis]|uniref:Uncharacterized protein n=1 Tax=Nonomuraea jiangxiensis TaxID=633440 RepID=A0A1G8S5U9_9ACTN|nr:hypothetical protein [Nonomuraea jiangxiensis]SDJ24165.1 hypothetical protein SAMN05421869_109271 [Nonomuraea jiangxiensis]